MSLLLLASLLAAGAERPAVSCREIFVPVEVDGSLAQEKWDQAPPTLIGSEGALLRVAGTLPAEKWRGPGDASASLWFAYDRAHFYVAGEVRDDVHLDDPQVWWAGDAIELFLRFSSEPAPAASPGPEDLQIFLLPLSAARPWGVAIQGRRRGPGDGGFVGVRVAAKPLSGGGGYTFEAAIPLVNLPGFPVGGGRIGFNVALDDADEATAGTETYLVWFNPGPPPAFDMRARGWLDVVPTLVPPPVGGTPSRLLEDVGFAGGVLLLLLGLFALAAREGSLAISRSARVVALLVLALLSLPLSAALLRGFESSREREFREAAQRVESILSAASSGEIGSLEGPSGAEAALRLLSGEPVRPLPRLQYAFPPFPESCAPDSERAGDVPFSRYRIPLREGVKVPIDLLPPRLAGAIHVALTAAGAPSPPSARPRSVALRLEDAEGLAETFELDLGSGERRAAFGGSGLPSEVFARVLRGARPLARIEVESLSAEPVVLEGVTLSYADGYDPLLLGAPTASGVPTRIRGPQPGKALVLAPGEAGPAEWDLGAREAERIFVVYGEGRGSGAGGALSFRGYGTTIVQGTVEFAEGPPLGFDLRHGVDLHAADLERSRHAPDPGRNVEIAFVWEEGGERRHLDIRSLDLNGRRPVRRLLLQNVSDPATGYPVEVREVVLATSRPVPDPAPGSPIASVPEGRKLGDEAARGLFGLRFGFVDLFGRPLRRGGGHPVPRATPEELASCAGGARPRPELREEPRDQGTWRALLALREGGRPIGAIVVTRSERRVFAWRRVAGAVRTGLAFLAAPFLLVAAADRLARGRRLRVKLAGALLLTSVAPLLLFAFGFADLHGAREEEIERGRLEAEVTAARERLARAVEEIDRTAARFAESFLTDPRVREALGSPEAPDLQAWREAVTRARRAVVGEAPDSFVGIEVVDARRRSPARFHLFEGEGGRRLEGAEISVSDLYRLWGEHVRIGVDRVREGERTFVFLVGAPPLPPSLEEAAQIGESGIRLYSREGWPVAPARLVENLEGDPPRAAAVQGLAARAEREGGPVCAPWVERGVEGRMAVDLVRDREGRPVAALAAFGRSAEPTWNLGFLRVRSRGVLLALAAAFVASSLVVARILTTRITRPVERLERGARALERGEAPAIEAESEDEVGRLTRSFNRMALELRRRLTHLSALNRAFQDLSSRLDLEAVLEEAVRVFRTQAAASHVLLAVREPEGGSALLLHGEGIAGPRPASGFLRSAVEAGEVLTLLDDGEDPLAWMPGPEGEILRGSKGVLVLPLRVGSRSLGCAILAFDAAPPAQRDFLLAAAAQVSIALENARLYRLAVEDPETGALHPSAFRRRVAEEIERVPGRPVAVVLFSVPPEAGERGEIPAGIAAARALLRAVRGRFPVGRTRPEELALVLPGVERRRAARFAERARRAVARSLGEADPASGAEKIAAAAGSFPRDGASAEFLLNEVDRALRRVRGAGGPVALPRETAAEPSAAEEEGGLVARADAMVDLLSTVGRIAPSDLPVLIQGETGVGKELFAEEIHRRSHRAKGPLVKVNCAAIPEALLESELFGHERGAFTGADRRRLGRFELASGGTLFLDEVAELPIPVQAKLLRVLQEAEVTRLGAESAVPVDVRIVAATNRELRSEMARGAFRPDLFYRLNSVSLLVPPLRERKEDIPVLARAAIRRSNEREGTRVPGLSPEALDRLFTHSWPGNVRELFNVLGRACVLRREGEIRPEDLALEAGAPAPEGRPASATLTPVEPSVTARQKIALGLLAARGWITTREYIRAAGVSERTGLRDLSDLVSRGVLIRVGSRRGTAYRLAVRSGTGTEQP
ncbi:MAG TPA: sigma 54-interacting transcriptional regulator [Planctomycetota bacterium]|nr:sigma 54-interacting transcriptional regulator [Planctomycetota bacterium]